MIAALLLSVALAGAPPPEAIPWDSLWIDDSPPGDTTMVLRGHYVYFITREKYEYAMSGQTKKNLSDVKADLAILKELLKQEEAQAAEGDE